MDMAAMRPIGQGHPDRVNDHTPDPVAHGVRDSFAQDGVRAGAVRVEASPSARAKQPAFDALASVDLVLADGSRARKLHLEVELSAHQDATADEGRLVLEQLHEAGRWRHHTVLV